MLILVNVEKKFLPNRICESVFFDTVGPFIRKPLVEHLNFNLMHKLLIEESPLPNSPQLLPLKGKHTKRHYHNALYNQIKRNGSVTENVNDAPEQRTNEICGDCCD